jgi:hypothetical protein
MCDYSLHEVATRPAKVGDELVTTQFANSITRGFAAVGEPNVAVCLLPGTEVAFEHDIEFEGGLGFLQIWKRAKRTGERLARFQQVHMDRPHVHHDALEFPNGDFVLAPCVRPRAAAARERLRKSTEHAGRCVCSGWKCLSGKTRSPPSFDAPRTRRRPTSALEASGAARCATRWPTSRFPSPWTSSLGARAVSTPAPLGSLGGLREGHGRGTAVSESMGRIAAGAQPALHDVRHLQCVLPAAIRLRDRLPGAQHHHVSEDGELRQGVR